MLKTNFNNQTVFVSHASQAIIAFDSLGNPITDAVYSISGNTSKNTTVVGNRVIIAKDEKAEKIILTVSKGNDFSNVILIVDKVDETNTSFDESNIILTFGIISDPHVSGSWNQQRSAEKWVHCIKSMQESAGRNADGSTKLNAFVCAGDFIDSINSFGNVSGGTEEYGYKGAQNYREVAYIRSGLEGKETNQATENSDGKPIAKINYGNGLEKNVNFFYCLGNHDEKGKGISNENERYSKVYTAKYFVAVMCGWKYSSNKGNRTPDKYDDSYISYSEDLLKIHNAPKERQSALLNDFTLNHGTDGNYAYNRFCAYYGNDSNYSEKDCGLFFGNRHTVINGIHFIAIEVSQCDESAEFLDKWCKQSVLEDDKKPIIVITHEKIYHTIYASVTGHTGLMQTLAKYPQCIVWTGHTHTPLTNSDSIMSDCGFTAVEGSVTAYLSCEGIINAEDVPAGNFCRKEEHNFGHACLVKIDKNHSVKIEKIDLHRSYNSEFAAENTAIFFDKPWIISNISSNGQHLLKYNIERSFKCNNKAPVFPKNAQVTLSNDGNGKITVHFPAAHEDGNDVVKYYKVELINPTDKNDAPWQYATSFSFRYTDEDELIKNHPNYSISFPAQKENRISASLDKCVEFSTPKKDVAYIARVTAYDSWHCPGETITSK